MANNNQKHVQRNVGPGRVNEKPKDFKKAIKKLLGYKKSLIPAYIITIILSIASSVCSIVGPNKLSELTDVITEGLMKGIDLEKVINITIFLLVLYVVSAIFSFLTSFIMATTANNLARTLRTKCCTKINLQITK